MKKAKQFDYSAITESPGLKATQEQLARLYQRYNLARQFAQKKNVLEVACGSGIGLGYLAKVASTVIGIDIEEKNVALAKKYFHDIQSVYLFLMDAHNLSFADKNFDLILLYEAIYYLREPQKFIYEAERVLREDGVLLICSVNKDWPDFHPSPYTYKYFSVNEIYDLLKNSRFKEIKVYGAFPVNTNGLRYKVISFIKRIAIKFDLIPGSLKARAYLKRVFMGKLISLPERIYEDMAQCEEPIPISKNRINHKFKIIYALAMK